MASVTATDLDRRILVDLYRQMLLVRKCELQLAKSHQQGLVHGACHTCVGQEAVPAGICAHLNRDDVVFSTHRGHGHALAKGVDPEQLFAELYGRTTGCSGGRGGSMHLFAPEVGMMGTSGIVGPCILQAVGAGYSFKLLGQDRVAVAFFGDGAVNNGAFHEGLNLASIWKLPVLFVCENNQYATEIAFHNASGNPHVANRGASYGLPSAEVDGNDALAVYRAAQEATARARRGGGATLIECKTYRVRPHAEGMIDYTYRTRQEVDEWRKKCPLQRVKTRLAGDESKNGFSSSAEIDSIDEEVTNIVKRAHELAVSSPFPPGYAALDHVYSSNEGGKTAATATISVHERPLRQAAAEVPTARDVSFSEATLEALSDALANDPTIFVMGEGIGERGGNFNTTSNLHARYGSLRLCDTPICERGFVGLSAGAAMTGTRPVIDFMFADFILDAVGEILNQIAKIQYMSNGRLKMPVVLRGCIGIGHSAATHHSGSYYSMFAHFPGLRVVVPSGAYEAKGLMATALRSDDPVIFLEPRELLSTRANVPANHYEIPFGHAAVLRNGTDVTVVGLGSMVHKAMQAGQVLAEEGIDVEIVDPRTVAPLDVETIVRSVTKTGRLLVLDETFAPFGVGAEIAAAIQEYGFDELDAPVRRMNGAHTPTPYSPSLEKAVVPQVDDILSAIRDIVNE